MAGIVYNGQTPNPTSVETCYLYDIDPYHTATPYYTDSIGSSSTADMFGVQTYYFTMAHFMEGIRPVIVLANGYTISSGNGSSDKPFIAVGANS